MYKSLSRHRVPFKVMRGPVKCLASRKKDTAAKQVNPLDSKPITIPVVEQPTVAETSVVAEPKKQKQKATLKSVRVFYKRPLKDYAGFGLHVWGDALSKTAWATPLPPTGSEGPYVYFDVPLTETALSLGLLVHSGEDKDGWEGVVELATLTPAADGLCKLYIVSAQNRLFTAEPTAADVPIGSLTQQAAHWVAPDLLLWRVPGADASGSPTRVALHGSDRAELSVAGDGGVQGATWTAELAAIAPADVPASVWTKYPYLKGCTAFQLAAPLATEALAGAVQCQLAAELQDAAGAAVLATGVQIQGVLDAAFFYPGDDLGCKPLFRDLTPDEDAHVRRMHRDRRHEVLGAPLGWRVSLWAPTALTLELLIFDNATAAAPAATHPLQKDAKGVWRLRLEDAALTHKCYVFRSTAYHPATNALETTTFPDPYTRAASADSARTFFMDPLTDPASMPEGWAEDRCQGPNFARLRDPSDIVLYELHVRDFSAVDATVPAALRGTYAAFTLPDATCVQHLKSLAEAGVTHVHLLPWNDFGSVPERRADRAPDLTRETIAELAEAFQKDGAARPCAEDPASPTSLVPQRLVLEHADRDSMNWGYDPVLFFAPEGSYASDPDSPTARVREARAMVQAMHAMGLRSVIDVVFNHVFHSGPSHPLSVLDKAVPGYYQRRSETGAVLHSTCCNNTACENEMMGKLVVDCVTYWAKAFHLDGFRFDIMGHLMLATVTQCRDRLAGMTLARHGVDGGRTYLYGESWSWAEVAGDARGVTASIGSLTGTSIGSFNDRIRDNAMGGGPFAPDPRYQGWVTGLATAPNPAVAQGSLEERRRGQLFHQDALRLAMAGSLRDFIILSHTGKVIRGRDWVSGDGLPVAFAQMPCESINYVSCHDNRTLMDQIYLKAPEDMPLETRIRMHMIGMALVVLSQGIPFLHAGDELLRSKCLDRDAYNSGDYFNRLDYAGADNNFGFGLPPASKNAEFYPFYAPILANAALRPSPAQIAATQAYVKELLRIRGSSKLFRLPTAFDVHRHVKFHNQGPAQVVGLLFMQLQSVESSLSTHAQFSIDEENQASIDETLNASLDELDALADSDLPAGVAPYFAERAGPLPAEFAKDPEFKNIFVVINARPDAVKIAYPQGIAKGLALHPVCAQSVDAAVRATEVPEGERHFVVQAWTTAVLVERW